MSRVRVRTVKPKTLWGRSFAHLFGLHRGMIYPYCWPCRGKLRDMGFMNVESLRAARRGRFYVLSEGAFVLVGRNDGDNHLLLADAPDDARILELVGNPGPLACLIGAASDQEVEEAKALVVRHSRFKDLPTSEVGVRSVAEAREGG